MYTLVSTRLISWLYLLCATFSGEPLLELLKLDQNCLSVIFHLDQFEHLLALIFVATHITAPVRASFQSDCYTPEASAFLHSLHS